MQGHIKLTEGKDEEPVWDNFYARLGEIDAFHEKFAPEVMFSSENLDEE